MARCHVDIIAIITAIYVCVCLLCTCVYVFVRVFVCVCVCVCVRERERDGCGDQVAYFATSGGVCNAVGHYQYHPPLPLRIW